MIYALFESFWSSPRAWLATVVLSLGSGCTGGAWLERPLAAELPVDLPENGYPTAVRGPLPEAAARQAGLADLSGIQKSPGSVQPAALTTAEKPAIEPVAPPASRLQRQQPLVTPLAVVPPELVPATRAGFATAQLVNSENQPAPPTTQARPLVDSPPLSSFVTNTPDIKTWISDWQPDAAPTVSPAHAVVAKTPAAESSVASVAAISDTSRSASEHEAVALEKVRGDFILALESEIRSRREQNINDEEIPRLEQQLRLVYLTAGRLDDAVAAVESLDAQQQEAYKNLMFGLGVWLSPDEARRAPLRSAKVLHSLRDATSDLAASSKLELKNLVFCERVDYFGWYTEFPKKEFQPKQQVILYVEVENFAAEQKGPAGYETELQGSYEILDGSGQIIASRQLQLDKEICRNYRRDYFLAYRIYMPESITPGRYRLELTVEDLKARGKYQGRKLGEGMIEFGIR